MEESKVENDSDGAEDEKNTVKVSNLLVGF